MPEVVGLNVLVGLADAAADNADGVLDDYAMNGRIHEQADKVESVLGEFGVAEPSGRPVHPADTQVSAGRVGDEHVPALMKDVSHVSLMVWAGRIGRQDVARHGLMPEGAESVPDCAGGFAGNKDFHGIKGVSRQAGAGGLGVGFHDQSSVVRRSTVPRKT